jgi:nitrogen regulatory protein PII-like uncharacterized protein
VEIDVPKFNISLNVDIENIAPELLAEGKAVSPEQVEEAFSTMILNEARQHAKAELHAIRRDAVLDSDVKAIKMAEQLRKIMFSMMAECNMTVTPIAESTPIQTELPFEQRYAA